MEVFIIIILICVLPGIVLVGIPGSLCFLWDKWKSKEQNHSDSPDQVAKSRNPIHITPTTSPFAAPNPRVKIHWVPVLDEQKPPPVQDHIPPAGWNPTQSKGLTMSEKVVKEAKPLVSKQPKGDSDDLPGSIRDMQLVNSRLDKELMQDLSVVQQDMIRYIRNGAGPKEIKAAFGKDGVAMAEATVAKLYEDFRVKVAPMVQAGMSMEDILKAYTESNTQYTTSSYSDGTPMLPERESPTEQTGKSPRQRKARKSSATMSQSTPDLFPAPEGGRKPKTNYAVVRSAKLRKAAIEIHGRNCCACRRNFDEMYGPELAKGYIEIHHLNRIATGERTTDPVTDLAPLCSNCHRMADRLSPPPRTIAELRYQLFPEFRLQEKEVAPAAKANKSPVKIRIGKIREKKPKKDS